MDNRDITSEKRIRVVIGVLVIAFLLLILNLATLMSVLPSFLESKIAHAPTGAIIDPFIPEWSCKDFKTGDTIDQFNLCFDYFLEEGRLSPAYPPKKMYQPYTIEKLPDSIIGSYF